jgi:hypothetical protein
MSEFLLEDPPEDDPLAVSNSYILESLVVVPHTGREVGLVLPLDPKAPNMLSLGGFPNCVFPWDPQEDWDPLKLDWDPPQKLDWDPPMENCGPTPKAPLVPSRFPCDPLAPCAPQDPLVNAITAVIAAEETGADLYGISREKNWGLPGS